MINKRDEKFKNFSQSDFLKKNQRGQVTIFIIIAVVIVALVVLIYSFYPRIQSALGIGRENPPDFIQTCIEDEIKSSVEKVSLQGGSINPEHYILYDNEKIEYLCYTGEDLKYCTIQHPLLKRHIENEIKNEIEDEVELCFDSLKQSYEKRGYNVNKQSGDIKIELLPERILATFNYSVALTKGETERYDSFRVVLKNNLYELVAITTSILEWEATYGNAEPTVYMELYHNLKVEMDELSDETKIYILTDKKTRDKFQFASKSLTWPEGWVLE